MCILGGGIEGKQLDSNENSYTGRVLRAISRNGRYDRITDRNWEWDIGHLVCLSED